MKHVTKTRDEDIMKKIFVVFGTRPEAIKMCPVIQELNKREGLQTVLCATGQHKEMLEQVLSCFQIKTDYNLDIMKADQDLFDISIALLSRLKEILTKEKPDIVLVHGDTSTAFITALACFYLQIPIGHVEAGLRTFNMQSPFPEEFNRQGIDLISDFYFAPTKESEDNLLKEGKDCSKIYVTGNTVVDALATTIQKEYEHPILDWAGSNRLIVLTAHRRENIGIPMKEMFKAIVKIVEEKEDIRVVYPVHKNPKVRKIANNILNHPRIKLIEPMEVKEFHNLLNRSYLILTDSGGIQEEAAALHKPVLVMREATERAEGIHTGVLKLVGIQEENIYRELKELLENKKLYLNMCQCENPYGDGKASSRIVDVLVKHLKMGEPE